MADALTPSQRSELMSRIRSSDTKPEVAVRKLIHSWGYRYRLGGCGLPGRPDLVFPGRNAVIFVHGCYWHRHSCRKGQSVPTTRQRFWLDKFEKNRLRDQRVRRQLNRMRWRCLIVWECQLKNPDALKHRIDAFLNYSGK